MSPRQKLGLLAVFCLVAVTMVFSLVRVIVGLRGAREDDVWFFLCATIELAICKLTPMPNYRPTVTLLTFLLSSYYSCMSSVLSLLIQGGKETQQ
jgi:hypothetical protein